MKTGLTLQEMAAEIDRREKAKRDFIADTSMMEMEPRNDGLRVTIGDTFLTNGITNHAHGQVASDIKIPKPYYDRMLADDPELLAINVNRWWRNDPRKRMVRVLDGDMRALVSDRYRALDNYDLFNGAVFPELMEFNGIQVVSSDLTETRCYLKAVYPRVEMEVKKGDVVQIGLSISNSEVGAGALRVEPLVYRLICLNGMIAADWGQKRYHVGKRAESTEDAYELYSDATRRADDRAFFMKVRDTVRGVMTRDVLGKIVGNMQDALGVQIAEPVAAVEEVRKTFGYSEEIGGGILNHLIHGGDLSLYGMMNAVTRASQDVDDYDLATKMEADGGRVITLPKTDWKRIAEAA